METIHIDAYLLRVTELDVRIIGAALALYEEHYPKAYERHQLTIDTLHAACYAIERVGAA
jgi:hypothetical protein